MINAHRRFAYAVACLASLAAGFVAFSCSDDDPVAGEPELDAGPLDAPAAADTYVPDTAAKADTNPPGPNAAAANITSTGVGGSTITGLASFVELDGSVNVSINVSNAPPGMRGLHVHANGSCDDAGAAAGGHFNPLDASHAYPDGAVHHPGDFGNIVVNDAGVGTLTLTSTTITVSPGPTSVVGHAIIVHQGTDDGVTQPTGDAGARIGCGVIQKL
jgi:Cu-Zn family superoxide dismutase